MEHDAETLKTPMVNYLEALTLALEENKDDPEELVRIYNKIVADKGYLTAFETRINEQVTYLRNFIAKRAEITDLLGRGIRERKA